MTDCCGVKGSTVEVKGEVFCTCCEGKSLKEFISSFVFCDSCEETVPEDEANVYHEESVTECHVCCDKRDLDFYDGMQQQATIVRNYPMLEANVQRSITDPVSWYHECKNPGVGQ